MAGSDIAAALRAVLPADCVLSREEDRRPYECDALTAFRELPGRISALAAPLAGGAGGDIQVSDGRGEGGRRTTQLKRMLAEKVKAEPESASRLVEGWVQKEDKS